MKLDKNKKLMGLFWMLSFLVAVLLLLGFEITLRLAWPQTERTLYENDISIGMEDPQLGHVYRPFAKASAISPEFTAEYAINGNGLRDSKEHAVPKPADLKRILILGDSFTFGAGSDYGHIWPVLLEEKLQSNGDNIDIVKAGVQGYDTRSEVLYLERLFPMYEPDIVILAFLPNDLFTNRTIESNVGDDMESGDDAPQARYRRQKIGTLHISTLAKRLLLKSDDLYCTIYTRTARGEYFRSPPGDRLQKQIEITKDLLLRAIAYCSERGCELVVLSIPQQFQVLASTIDYQPDEIDVRLIDRIMSEFAEENGITWMPALETMSEIYQSEGNDLYFRLDGHLTKRGNEAIADYLFTELKNNSLIQ